MSSLQSIKDSFKRRLINMVRHNLFGHFETTISEYEKEIGRKRKLLEMINHPDLKRQGTALVTREESFRWDQEDPGHPHLKDESGQPGNDEEDCGGFQSQSNGTFYCSKCDIGFRKKSGLAIHLRGESHKNFDPASCSRKAFQWPDPDNRFQCSKCGNTYKRKRCWEKHMRSHTAEKPFGCHVCGKKFALKTILHYHLKTHSPQKPLSCSVCGMTLKNKTTLKSHMGIHTGIKPYGCSVCHKRFRFRCKYNVHKCVDERRRPVSCPKCGETLPNRAHLKRHMRTHKVKAKKLFKCKVCSLELELWSQMKEHMKTHKEEKKLFKCKVCTLELEFSSQLKEHMKNHPKVGLCRCPVCGKAFSQKGLRQHMVVHLESKPFSCRDCGRGFFWPFQLKRHRCSNSSLRKNLESVQNSLSQMDDDFWKDTRTHQSGFTYQRKNKVSDTEKKSSCSDVIVKTEPKDDGSVDGDSSKENKHIETVLKTEDEDVSVTEEDGDTYMKPLNSPECHKGSEDSQVLQARMESHMREKPFSCFFCRKEFINGGYLTRHVSVHTGEQLLTCIICEESFTTELQLIQHVCVEPPELPQSPTEGSISDTTWLNRAENGDAPWRRPSGENLFICSTCGERFPTLERLNLHMTCHTGDKSLRCSLCNTEFNDREMLNQHMGIHMDQTQFKCVICHEKFVWRRYLTRHMEIHEKEGLHTCSKCNKVFSSRADLAFHVCTGKPSGRGRALPEPVRNSDPCSPFKPVTNDNPSHSSDTEDSECWDEIKQRPSGSTHENGQSFNYQSDDSVDSDFWKDDKKAQSPSTSLMDKQVSQSDAACDDSQAPSCVKEKQKEVDNDKFTLNHGKKEEEAQSSQPPVSSSTEPMKTADCGEPEPGRKVDPARQPGTDNKASGSLSLNSVVHEEIAVRDVGCDSGENPSGCSDMKSAESLEPESNNSVDSDFWKEGTKPPLDLQAVKNDDMPENGKKITNSHRCPECGENFPTFILMKAHWKLHSATETPFVCSVCGLKCLYESHLSIHMRTHTGEKPFPCPICGKKYAHKSSMQNHLAIHTVEKRYSCSVCERSFAWHTELKYHKCVGESSHEKKK
ncbi:hypothetical protein INR49_007156 [Caranx melampygus]|nr:hypothetical protein INR49_007156 [Caranx melampygus]